MLWLKINSSSNHLLLCSSSSVLHSRTPPRGRLLYPAMEVHQIFLQGLHHIWVFLLHLRKSSPLPNVWKSIDAFKVHGDIGDLIWKGPFYGWIKPTCDASRLHVQKTIRISSYITKKCRVNIYWKHLTPSLLSSWKKEEIQTKYPVQINSGSIKTQH